MTSNVFRFAAVVCALLSLAVSTASAQGDDVAVRLSTGVNFTSGDYGGTDDIEDTYIPFTVSVDRGRIGYRLTVPYLSVDVPSGIVTADPDGEPVPGSGARITESGLGDVIGSITLYDVIYNRDRGIAMDITGKVKFATADEFKGLGTGEHDYSIRADFFRFFNQITLIGSAGYKVRGNPAGFDLENVILASVGGIVQAGPHTRVGLMYDYRESAFANSEPIRELTGFVSKRLSDTWRLQFYVVNGQSVSSPDWGAGISLKVAL